MSLKRNKIHRKIDKTDLVRIETCECIHVAFLLFKQGHGALILGDFTVSQICDIEIHVDVSCIS